VLASGAVAFGHASLAFAADTAVMPHGQWDAWAIWNLRARFLYRGYPEYWRDAFSPVLAWSHVDYPLLVPLSVARVWTFLGRESPAVPPVLAAIFALSTVIGAAGSVARVRSATRGGLTAVAILACPSFVTYSSSQCADTPLAFFILATFMWMFRAVESPSDRSAWLLAGVSAGLAAWTKNEGALFLVICVTVVAIRSAATLGRAGPKCAGTLLAGALPMILALVTLKGLARENDLLQAQSAHSLLTAFGSVDRLTTILAGLGQALWLGGASGVGVLPIVAAFVFAVGLERTANPVPYLGLVTLVLLIAGYACVFAITPHDLAWQMKTSLDRVMLHAFPTLVWCGMMLARD
jgi:4-amino-4-deoxy-L-arabinose transferase-like glycosyltransferase